MKTILTLVYTTEVQIMKKILLSLLMGAVVANSVVSTTVQAATDFDEILGSLSTEKKRNKVDMVDTDESYISPSKRLSFTAQAEKSDIQKKIILAIVAALGLSYYFGKDTFTSMKAKITRALSGEENPVDYALGELISGFMGKAAHAVDLPTEKDIVSAQRACEKLQAELIKANVEDKAEIIAELEEATHRKLDMELTLYKEARNNAADVARQAAADKKELEDRRKEINLELANNKDKCYQAKRDISSVSEESKASLCEDVKAFNERNRELVQELKLVEMAIDKVVKELAVQGEDDARLRPNKRTKFEELDRKFRKVKIEWDKSPEEFKEKIKKEKEEAEQAQEYFKRRVTGTIKREVDVQGKRRGVVSALNDEDFKTGAQALTSVVSAVISKLL